MGQEARYIAAESITSLQNSIGIAVRWLPLIAVGAVIYYMARKS